MRNLKRALSLALAAIMLVGMMVVGAGAVSYNDFSDRTEIVNKDAVSMLTTLGVIDGKPDGSYAPEEYVTREQMAKMISVIMNQGSDNNDLFVGVPSGLTDVAGNWALGHINYCYSLGIIAGRGDGKFDPTANVTASEAAKMLLVAAGYNPNTEGFVGADWAVNVNAKASALGIFRNYTKSTMADLNRDDAALLIYNALDVEMIQKYEDGYAIAFNDHRTILAAMYGVYKVEGVVVANKWAQLQGTDTDAALRDGRTTLDNVIVYSSTTANTTTGEYVRERTPITFNVDTSVELLGKTVTLFIEKTTILSDSKVLGVTLNDNVNVIKASNATASDVDKYLKGTGMSCDKDTQYYFNYGVTTAADAISGMGDKLHEFQSKDNTKFNLNGVELEVIDNDNDGIVEYVLYLQETLSTVRTYSERNETISVDGMNMDKNNVSRAMEFEDVVFADEVDAQDLVLFVEYGGRAYISLPETLIGTMTRIDRDKNDELYITVDGEEYRQSFIPNRVDSETATDFIIDAAKTAPGFSDEVEFIFDSNGYIVAYQAPKATDNWALVLGSAWTQNALDKSGQIKVLLTDGTEQKFDLDWDDSAKAFKNIDVDINGDNSVSDDLGASNSEKLEGYLGTRDVNMNDGSTYYRVNTAAGSVISYSLDDNNKLTIESVLTDTYGTGDSARTRIVYADGDHKTATPNTEPGYKYVNGQMKNLKNYVSKGTGNATNYRNGDGTLYVSEAWGNSNDALVITGPTKYAVDLDTVAFYYYIENGEAFYGVAVGYNDMKDTTSITMTDSNKVINHPDDSTSQGNNVYVKTKDKTSNKLAEVVLFNEKVTFTSSNYLFVLSANAVTKDYVVLNVVLEDGSAQTINVKTKNVYESNGRTKVGDPFEKEEHYLTAWRYTNLDGDPTLIAADDRVANGYAHLVRNKTVVLNAEANKYSSTNVLNTKWDDITDGKIDDTHRVANPGYYTVTNENVWDVTDMEKSSNDAAKGNFLFDTAQRAVLVVDDRTNTVVAGWIWAVDTKIGTGVTLPVGDDMKLVQTGTAELTLSSNKTPTLAQIRNLVNAWVEKNYSNAEGIDLRSNIGGGYTVTVTLGTSGSDTYTLIINSLTDRDNVIDQLGKGENVVVSGNVDAGDYKSDDTPAGYDGFIQTTDPNGNEATGDLVMEDASIDGKLLVDTEIFVDGEGLTIETGAKLKTGRVTVRKGATLVVDGDLVARYIDMKAGSAIVYDGYKYSFKTDMTLPGWDLSTDGLTGDVLYWGDSFGDFLDALAENSADCTKD